MGVVSSFRRTGVDHRFESEGKV